MFADVQPIQNPFGITVFGSSIIRVEPDLALLRFTISRLAKHPKGSFQETHQASQKISNYLNQARINDVGSSRISLSESYRYVNNQQQFEGYIAAVNYNIMLRDLDRMEEILSGIVDAGANRIDSVDFQTSRLKEFRAEARRQAVIAAQEKALIYCDAAGVNLGPVLHIDDVNPDQLRGREGHQQRQTPIEDETLTAFNPGSIIVGGAVRIAFAISQKEE